MEEEEEDDPLTQVNFNRNKQSADQTELSFYPEVKIEEHELDQLPKIEVLESMTNLDASTARRLRKRVKAEAETVQVITEEAAPKKRRGRPRKTEIPKEKEMPQEQQVPNTNSEYFLGNYKILGNQDDDKKRIIN